LPLIQGGSSAYVVPALTIAARIKATGHFANDHERFLVSDIRGGILQTAGVFNKMLRKSEKGTVLAGNHARGAGRNYWQWAYYCILGDEWRHQAAFALGWPNHSSRQHWYIGAA
jgi:hypothetical protein